MFYFPWIKNAWYTERRNKKFAYDEEKVTAKDFDENQSTRKAP